MSGNQVLQFKITLKDIKPAIWRRIQISDACSFWDLHVAIQDAMGWTDSHLHAFTVSRSNNKKDSLAFGIPDNSGFNDEDILPGWEHTVNDYLPANPRFEYEYDFGDGWIHSIEYEGTFPKQDNTTYPLCLSGKRACPPEDIGGPPGYEHFIEVIGSPQHPEYESFLEWFGDMDYDPNEFDPKTVVFDCPKERLELANE